jgi:S1-C subfamily serine protease
MTRFARAFLIFAVALVTVLPGFGQQQKAALAQDDSATAFSFRDLDFNELITSSVFLLACDSLPVTGGTIDLQTFERASGVCWTGSGTVIDPSGRILTNAHVALDSSQTEPLWVLVHRTVDSRSLPQPAFFARAVLYSPAWGARQSFGQTFLDLAVLEPARTLDGAPIQPGEVTMRPLPMAPDEGTVSIGDELRNIGYPGIGGDLITITEGSVSGFEPDNDVRDLGNAGWIKTDATLGGGISGGTSINEDGMQIGVPTEAGGRDVRTICEDENGNMVPCNIGQLNHIRPVPEGFALLQEVG